MMHPQHFKIKIQNKKIGGKVGFSDFGLSQQKIKINIVSCIIVFKIKIFNKK